MFPLIKMYDYYTIVIQKVNTKKPQLRGFCDLNYILYFTTG